MRESAAEAGRDPDALRFIVRGVTRLTDGAPDADPERRMLHGTAAQIRGDVARLADAGVTEVFFDLNFVAELVSADADPAQTLAQAERVLTSCAPTA